jgi:photosystem II stability/assembly factor-like uncharacterized protein
LLHSRDFETPELGEIELGHCYERAMARAGQLRARRAPPRAAGGAALACLVATGLVVGSFAATTPGRLTVPTKPGRGTLAGPRTHQTGWRLVSDVSAAGSSWRALSPSGYKQTFSLVCPTGTTCYADSVGGQLEYTHDGGSSWRQALGTGIATSLPQIWCAGPQDCHVLADITGRGSTFLTTTDGGQSWTSEPGPALSPNSLRDGPGAGAVGLAMSCGTISSCVVIVYDGASSGSSSEVFTTADGGASWSQGILTSSASVAFVPSGLSCSGTTCVTVGSLGTWESRSGSGGRAQGVRTVAGAAYISDDGGATWSASSAPPDTGVISLTCSGDSDCYAISASAVYETQDGGQTWHQVRTSGLPGGPGSSSSWNFISMSCPSSSSCWLTGAGGPNNPAAAASSQRNGAVSIGQAQGLLASTSDGGATWALSTVPAGVGGLIDITCPDTSTCFALGVEQTGSAPGHGKAVLLTN